MANRKGYDKHGNPLERTIQGWIRDAVMKEYPDCWDLNLLGGNFRTEGGGRASQRSGVPDLVFLIQGRFFGIEVKRPKNEGGGNATPKQQQELRRIRRAGGHATVVRSVEETLQFIRKEIE